MIIVQRFFFRLINRVKGLIMEDLIRAQQIMIFDQTIIIIIRYHNSRQVIHIFTSNVRFRFIFDRTKYSSQNSNFNFEINIKFRIFDEQIKMKREYFLR